MERSITLGQKTYPIKLTTNAAYLLDLHLRQQNIGNVGQFFDRVLSGNASLLEIQLLLWALMEGGRRFTKSRNQAFSIEEVGDLIDSMGGPEGGIGGGLKLVHDQVLDALKATQPKPEPAGDKDKGKDGGDEGKNG